MRAVARFRCSSRYAPESLLDSDSPDLLAKDSMARRAARARSPRGASARPRRLAKTPPLDAVTAQIIRGAMETICYEVSTQVSLAATSPILHPSGERNATILDARGRLVAQWVLEPEFLLASTLPIRFALD